LKYENAVDIYKKVVTHGPLDIKLMIGNSHPEFNAPADQAKDDLVKGYFKTN